MAKNQRGSGKRVRFVAEANRASGAFVYEDGFHGVVVADVASGATGRLDIEQVEHLVAVPGNPARGTAVYVTPAMALTTTASTNRLVGKVTETPATMPEIAAGSVWMLVLPQNITVPA